MELGNFECSASDLGGLSRHESHCGFNLLKESWSGRDAELKESFGDVDLDVTEVHSLGSWDHYTSGEGGVDLGDVSIDEGPELGGELIDGDSERGNKFVNSSDSVLFDVSVDHSSIGGEDSRSSDGVEFSLNGSLSVNSDCESKETNTGVMDSGEVNLGSRVNKRARDADRLA